MGRMVCYLGVHWWDTETRYLLLTMALYSTLAPSPGHADIYAHYSNRTPMLFEDLPALFGSSLPKDGLMGVLVESRPLNACSPVAPPPAVNSSILQFIALIRRLECNFDIKVLHAQRAGFSAAIVHNVNSDTLLHMSSSDERIAEKVWIPSVFTSFSTAQILKSFIIPERGVSVLIQPASLFSPWYYLIPISWILPICLTITLTVLVLRCVQWRRRMRRNRMTQKQLRKIPVKTFQKGDEYEVCVICLDGYEEGDRLRILPCSHAYHGKCVDTWLIQVRRSCPVCNTRVSRSGPECSDSESQAEREGAPPVPSPRQRCTPEPRPASRCSSETPGGTAMPPSQTGPPCQQGCGLDSRVINTVSHESVVFMC